jgi:hypothetical protein
LSQTGFVLIADGLGEQLGYNGFKVSLPVTILEENYSFLKYFFAYISACKERVLEKLP